MKAGFQTLFSVNLYFRSFFAYFDEKKCRWETEKDSCDDYATDSSDGVTDVTTTLDTDTTDATTDPIVETTKPMHQNLKCEPLDETWKCSSGSKNHSLCIKFCTIGLDLSRV